MLKWGEPAYRTEANSGSTIRLGRAKSSVGACAVLFNCRTTLVKTFRSQFPDEFAFQGNRAILLDPSAPLPAMLPLAICLALAMTYHRRRSIRR
jgi:hypothetical protein